MIIVNVYIKPEYHAIFSEIRDFIFHLSVEYAGYQILIGGDFNARIQNTNQLCPDLFLSDFVTPVHSYPDPESNRSGDLLVSHMEDDFFIVLNGENSR